MTEENERLQEEIRHLPRSPGVYLFRDSSGRTIYVGKALDLKQRVRSYFQKPPFPSARLKALVSNIHSVSCIVTDSEGEAFILESNLIKEHAPRYNVQFKDDKNYPYLRLTAEETFPRLEVARRVDERRSRYFGPYSNAGSVRETLRLIKKLFPLRSCRQPLAPEGSGSRPCLNFQIGRCLAPCSGEISPGEYGRIVEQVSLFLEGRQTFLLQRIRDEMEDAAENLEYEKASRLRDQYFSLQKLMERQKVVSSDLEDRDAAALVPGSSGNMVVGVFRVRDGKLLGSEHFIPRETAGAGEGEIMKEFLRHYYEKACFVPGEVLLSHEPVEKELLEDWLGQKRGRKVRLKVPKRGEKKALLELTRKNALLSARQEKERRLQEENALEDLAALLGLPSVPRRIEGYDISHFGGAETVGSMVVFEDGAPRRELYRRFRVRGAGAADDYAALKEVLERRFRRKDLPLPPLILIDGGRGQLSAALSALQQCEAGRNRVYALALAKEREHLFLPGQGSPLVLPGFHPVLKLLQRVRDEAHRFALSHSRQRSTKSSFSSFLENTPGIGPKRRKVLLNHFESLENLKGASLEEIQTVSGMDARSAQNLFQRLHAGGENNK